MMSKHKTKPPEWMLDEEWGIKRDKYNWILCRKSGKGWTNDGYYSSPPALFQGAFRKLLLTQEKVQTLEDHYLQAAATVGGWISSLTATLPPPPDSGGLTALAGDSTE